MDHSPFTTHNSLKHAFTLAEVFSPHCAGSRKTAFTLAEVLITLGIIGVVAALILPSLIQQYQERAQIVKLKKVYSILSSAFNTAVAENGSVNTWADTPTENLNQQTIAINNVMKNYIKYIKVCDFGDKSKCLSPAYTKTNGEKVSNNNNAFNSNAPKYFLADGTIISIHADAGDSIYNWCKVPESQFNKSNINRYIGARYYYKCGKIYVDTNGFKGPNRDGFDVFAFTIYQDTITPLGFKYDHDIENFKICTVNGPYGERFVPGTCTAWALTNENMDYLRCPKQLSWDGKKTCKN